MTDPRNNTAPVPDTDQPTTTSTPHTNRATAVALMILGVLCWAFAAVLHRVHPTLPDIEFMLAIGGAALFVAGVNKAGI